MKKINIFYFFAITALLLGSCEDKNKEELDFFFTKTETPKPNTSGVSFTNINADPITATTATINGTISITGTKTISQAGVCYSATNSTPTVSDISVLSYNNYSTSATLGCVLTNLTTNTTYYYRAYIFDNTGNYIYESTTHQFTTTKVKTPIVTTNNAQSITSNSATLSGSINENGMSIYTSGFCYSSTNTNPTISDYYTYAGVNSQYLSSLLPNTTYYVRAYAYYYDNTTFSYIYTYGTTVSFKTLTIVVDYTSYYSITSANETNIRLSEDFSSNTNLWNIGTFTSVNGFDYTKTLISGYYSIDYNETGFWVKETKKLPSWTPTDNFEIKIIIYLSPYVTTGYAGVLWGIDNSFLFAINASNYYIGNNVNSTWTAWQAWTYSSSITSAGYNELIIRKINNTYYFFINQIYITSHQDSTITNTDNSVSMVAQQCVAYYNSLYVYNLTNLSGK